MQPICLGVACGCKAQAAGCQCCPALLSSRFPTPLPTQVRAASQSLLHPHRPRPLPLISGHARLLHHVKSRQCVLESQLLAVRLLEVKLRKMGVRLVPTAYLTYGKVLGRGSYGAVKAAVMAAPCDGYQAVPVAVKHAVSGKASDGFGNPLLEVMEREISELAQLRCLLEEAVTYAKITADVGTAAVVVPLLGLEVASWGEVVGVVMPRVLGKTLAEYGATVDDMHHTLELLEAVARAVARLHAAGWVHGDLKELNIVVPVLESYPGSTTAGGVATCAPELIDLGMAVKLAPGQYFKNMGTTCYGTPGYCDPMIEAFGCISNVYSFGVYDVPRTAAHGACAVGAGCCVPGAMPLGPAQHGAGGRGAVRVHALFLVDSSFWLTATADSLD